MRDAMDMMNRNPQQNNGFNPNKLSPESIAQLIRMQGRLVNISVIRAYTYAYVYICVYHIYINIHNR